MSWTLTPLGLYAASRLMVLAAVRAVVVFRLPLAVNDFNGPWPTLAGGHTTLRALASWDASWYLFVASHGYSTKGHPSAQTPQMAFFPGWPAIVRYGSRVTHLSPLNFGVLATFVLGGVASCLLWRLFRGLTDQAVATRAIALWAFFPGSFVLSFLYAEGLTVTMAAICILCLLRRRWVLAGLAAGVATAVQPVALALTVCCVGAAVVAVVRERDWAAVSAPVLSVTGVVAYFAYLWNRTASPLAWYHVERNFWHSGDGFYHNTIGLIRVTLAHRQAQDVLTTVGLVWVLIGLGLMIRWRPPLLIWVFTIAVLVAALSSNPVGTRPRLLLVAFPLILAFAKYVRGTAFHGLLASTAFVLAAVTIMTVAQAQLPP